MRYPRFGLMAVLALATTPTAWGQPQAELVLHFVEIGQGDCTLIECPNGGFILVDAGSTAHGDRAVVSLPSSPNSRAAIASCLLSWMAGTRVATLVDRA